MRDIVQHRRLNAKSAISLRDNNKTNTKAKTGFYRENHDEE